MLTAAGIRATAAWILETFFGDKIFADTVRSAKIRTVGEYTEIVAQRNEFIRSFHEQVCQVLETQKYALTNFQVWNKYGFDGIIAPVQALPQLPHGCVTITWLTQIQIYVEFWTHRGCTNFNSLAAATILYNVLDHPVGVVPVTRVDPAKDKLPEEWLTGPSLGSRILESGIYKSKIPVYNPEATKGMPVSIQVVGKKWEDEKVLAMMHVVDSALGKGRGFGPGSWDECVKVKALI